LPKGIEECIVVWHWRVVEQPDLDLCHRSSIRDGSIEILQRSGGAIQVAGSGFGRG
jgi:hypothetical protein